MYQNSFYGIINTFQCWCYDLKRMDHEFSFEAIFRESLQVQILVDLTKVKNPLVLISVSRRQMRITLGILQVGSGPALERTNFENML